MTSRRLTISLLLVVYIAGCASEARTTATAARETTPESEPAVMTPPPHIQAWMNRLTVPHHYDPATGFIVADRTTDLPLVLADAPMLDVAITAAREDDRIVIAFATADRCAPCQQYKKDALNDPRVISRLRDGRLLATHVEVDRQRELAEACLGSASIPMTYALRNGEKVSELRGQRSPEELLAWLDDLLAG